MQKRCRCRKIEAYFSFKKTVQSHLPKLHQSTFLPADMTTGRWVTKFSQTTLGEIRTTLAITQTQYSGGDQFLLLLNIL
jgi:hypothetical protein